MIKCKHCDIEIPMCSCGVAECGISAHLNDCPSPAGDLRRESNAFASELRELDGATPENVERLKTMSEKYPHAFAKWVARRRK